VDTDLFRRRIESLWVLWAESGSPESRFPSKREREAGVYVVC